MLWSISLWLFCYYQFVFLNTSTLFNQPPIPLPFENHQSVLCIYPFISILIVSFFFTVHRPLFIYIYVCVCLFIYLFGWYWFAKPYRFQVYNSKHCTVCPPQVMSLFVSIFHLHLALIFFPSGCPHTVVCLCVMCLCFLVNSFIFLHLVSQPHSPLTAFSLFHVSISLFLFCSSAYFVHYIPHKWDHMAFVFLWLAYFT